MVSHGLLPAWHKRNSEKGPHLALCLLQLAQEMQCHPGGQTAQPQGGQGDTPLIQARGIQNQGLQRTIGHLLQSRYSPIDNDGPCKRLPGVQECGDVNSLCSRLVPYYVSAESLYWSASQLRQHQLANEWYVTLHLTCMLDLA